jgi:exodeoxyribonuclease-3
MKIATWNVNSIRQRESHVARWLGAHQPDVLVLQEIKCETAAFPAASFQSVGYSVAAVGQKAYNGVAVLSRIPFSVTHRALPGLPDADTQARYVEIDVNDMTIAGIYLPNGNSGGAEGYSYKLLWMDCLAERAKTLLASDRPMVILGDFNVCLTDDDLAPGSLSPDDALVRPESRAALRRLIWLGMTDAIRALHPHGPMFTFWDYQAAAWQRDLGLRIDHALLSPTLAERLEAADPDRSERGQPSPSDHVPVVVTLR